LLSKIFKKHRIWIDIVSSFGCNKDTAEDIVQEMYIKIQKNINNGLNIDYGEDYNYFYIFKTLKSMFLDLKRKEAKVIIVNIEDYSYFNHLYDTNFEDAYNKIQKELSKMYWYDKKVYQLLEGNESVAKLSRKTNIPYHSLYNTYRKVLERLKKVL
tara:strand:+ start:603 stop:1070 length:468 start_codon:yes stop_codon:yes gene_type:complete